MKFFVPCTNNETEAEVVYSAFAEFNKAPILERRIWKLQWIHNKIINNAEIGKSIIGDKRFGGEPVLAILELPTLYMICTPNRGGVRGDPILAGKNIDSIATFFENTK